MHCEIKKEIEKEKGVLGESRLSERIRQQDREAGGRQE
jgi:hypothetical protein